MRTLTPLESSSLQESQVNSSQTSRLEWSLRAIRWLRRESLKILPLLINLHSYQP